MSCVPNSRIMAVRTAIKSGYTIPFLGDDSKEPSVDPVPPDRA